MQPDPGAPQNVLPLELSASTIAPPSGFKGIDNCTPLDFMGIDNCTPSDFRGIWILYILKYDVIINTISIWNNIYDILMIDRDIRRVKYLAILA